MSSPACDWELLTDTETKAQEKAYSLSPSRTSVHLHVLTKARPSTSTEQSLLGAPEWG